MHIPRERNTIPPRLLVCPAFIRSPTSLLIVAKNYVLLPTLHSLSTLRQDYTTLAATRRRHKQGVEDAKLREVIVLRKVAPRGRTTKVWPQSYSWFVLTFVPQSSIVTRRQSDGSNRLLNPPVVPSFYRLVLQFVLLHSYGHFSVSVGSRTRHSQLRIHSNRTPSDILPSRPRLSPPPHPPPPCRPTGHSPHFLLSSHTASPPMAVRPRTEVDLKECRERVFVMFYLPAFEYIKVFGLNARFT